MPMGPMLSPNSLLGRQTAHWSYFVHSEGSPMEGNNWTEIDAGVFRAGRPTFKFHPMDLYIMGMLAPEDVRPAFVIANPDTMGQRDRNGGRINPASTPEFGDRNITIRGTRVNFGIEDIIRANGPRVPAAVTVPPTRGDGGVPRDGGAMDPRPSDLDVVWVLLTTMDRVGDRTARDFDRAIDECADGYSYATDGRSELIARVAPPPPPPDVVEPDASTDARVEDATAGDAGVEFDPTSFTVGGGCGCRVTPGTSASRSTTNTLTMCASLGAIACCVSRRRRRARVYTASL
jgi:hypothetical protein